MTKLQKLRLSSLVILGFFVAAMAYHHWQVAYEGRGYPYSTYFYQPSDIGLLGVLGMPVVSQISKLHCFGDLFLTWFHNRLPTPYSESLIIPSNYFPFAHAVTRPFSFSSYPLTISLFLVFVVGASLLFSWISFRDQHTDRLENAKLVLIFGLLTYPMQMILDRGNIEILVFLFVWGGLVQFRRRAYLSAFLLACATAMKGFPGLLFGLFFADRHYRALLFGLVWCAALTIVGLYMFRGGIVVNLKAIMSAAGRYASAVGSANVATIHFTSGWPGMMEGLAFWFPSMFEPDVSPLRLIRENYTIVRGVLLIYFVAPLLGIRRLELWQVAAPLTFAMVMILPAAYDYRLVLAMVPFAMFVNSHRQRRTDIWYVLLFSLLMVPKQFILLTEDIGIGTVINPIVMLSITGMIVWELAFKRSVHLPPRPAAEYAPINSAN